MDHYISYSEVENLTVTNLVSTVKEKKKKAIKSLLLTDLIFDNKSLIGVYAFFDNKNNAVYVGKTGSRAILERIASHLDLREGAFMNNFLCALAGKNKGDKKITANNFDIESVYENAIEHKFVFIGIPDKALINRVEKVLADKLKPTLNRLTKVKAYKDTDKIKDLLKE